MRVAVTPSPANRAASFPINIPAPVGGLNTRDGRAVMPITDAELMDNWFPEATDVRVRPGSETYCSGIGSQVETIFGYNRGGVLRLLVAAGGAILNVSTVQLSGTIPASSTIANGFSDDEWQYRSMGTSGGQFLVCVNGVDSGRQIYNGTTMFTGTVSAGAGTAAIFTNVEIFQRRLFYTQTDSLQFLYHDQVNAIGGTVSGFDLSTLMDQGGYLMAIGTWTRDGGSGMDDLIAFISSMGQVAVYQGTDPGDANAWSLVGVYNTPRPIGRRCTQKLGGELLIATAQGVVSLSTVMSGLEQQTPFSEKINTSIADAWGIYKNNSGWQLKYVPDLEWLILNVPVSTGDFQQQYVMNCHTKAWCRFKDLDANVWEVFNGSLYFGANGKVIQAGTGQSDDGADINIDVRQAPSTFGAPGRLKHFKIYRPMINSDGALGLAFAMNVDFSDAIPTNVPAVVAVSFAEWDVATWDDFYWGGDPVPVGQWQSAGAIGTYGSVRIKGAANETAVRWYGTDVVLEPGGMV